MTNLTNYWVYCVKHINVKTQTYFLMDLVAFQT